MSTTSPWAKLAINAANGETVPMLFQVASSTASGNFSLFSVDNTGLTTIGDSAGTGDAVFQFASDHYSWAAGFYSLDNTFRIASSTNLTSNVYFQIGKSGTTTLNSGITSSNTGQYLCINTATFEIGRNNTACSLSSIRFKENIEGLAYGLEAARQLRPVTFTFKPEMNAGTSTQVGFIAQEMEFIIPELVSFDAEGRPAGVNYPAVAVLLTNAIKELNLNLETIASTTASSTPQSENFAESFFSNVFSRLTEWFADAANGITEMIATRFRAKEEICVDDQCLTKEDVRRLIDIARNGQTAGAGNSSGGGST